MVDINGFRVWHNGNSWVIAEIHHSEEDGSEWLGAKRYYCDVEAMARAIASEGLAVMFREHSAMVQKQLGAKGVSNDPNGVR